MCRRIIRGQHDDPANGVIEHAGAQAEPRSVRRSCRFRMIAALTARDRLFTHANTAQTDSAIVPDFQRDMVSVLVYRQIAASATPARAKTVEA